MTKASKQLSDDTNGASLAAFLQSLPSDTPSEVIEAIDLFARADGPRVGPQVFFELVEQAPVAVSITDPKANIQYVNRAFERLTGYASEEIIGCNEALLSNEATPDSVYRDLWKTINAKRSWRGALVNRRKTGEAYLAELTISPVLNRDREISHFLGMHRDITNVHRLNARVGHQKNLLESVLDGAPLCVALLDTEQRVILDNLEYKKLLGDLRGDEPARLWCDAIAEQTDVDLPDCRSTGRAFREVEVRLDVGGSRGPRWFSVSGSWVDEPDTEADRFFGGDGGGTSLLLLARETTRERRETENCRIAHLRATMAEQQRVSGMREALAAATFQIQQPLNLVNAAINMLQRGGGGVAGQNLLPVMTQIAEAADRAHQALKSALPAESPNELPQTVNLNELLRDVLQLSTDRLLASGVVVTWLPQAVLPGIAGYSRALRALFMNLIDNAIQALKEGAGEAPEVRVTTCSRDDLVVVEISDNGVGLDPSQRLAVFEPLHCGWHNKRGHAGMGLSMVRDIAGRHGADVAIEPNPIAGARVSVRFSLSNN